MALHPVRNLFLVVLMGASARLALAGTYTVTNTDDAGPGSLRQAILDAASSGEVSTIAFAIDTGHQRIRPLSALPMVKATLIDGSTQPGYAGAPLIEVDGSLMASGGTCFDGVQQSAIDSLVINSCPFAGVRMDIGGVIRRSYIGTDVTGTIGAAERVWRLRARLFLGGLRGHRRIPAGRWQPDLRKRTRASRCRPAARCS